MLQKKKKRAKKSRGTYYFTKVHEDAIIEYSVPGITRARREELYNTYIGPVFSEMVDKIIYTYRFTNLPNIDFLKDECKVWLTTILDKYDPSKGSKAFSYFSVVKKNATQSRKEVYVEDLTKDAECEHLSTVNTYLSEREDREFWMHLWSEIDSWDTGNLKPNERKVLEAVRTVLDNSDNIEIFNKKAVYLYLREITGLNTKQVVNNLNKLRVKYRSFKGNWNEGKI